MARERDDRPSWLTGRRDPPPRDECEEDRYDTPVGDEGEILRVRQRRDLRGRLVDFAIIQMAPFDGHLVRVAAADICHDELHVHVFNRLGKKIARESLQAISTDADVDKGYDAGLDQIAEKWEYYKRRWRNG